LQATHGQSQPAEAPALAKQPKLNPIAAAGLREYRMCPVTYAVEPFLPRTLVLLGGHGGVGKSNLALAHGACAAAGYSIDGAKMAPIRVIFVSLEDPYTLVLFRLRKIVEAYGLDYGLIEKNFIILDGTGGDCALAVEFSDAGVRRIVPTDVMAEMRTACDGADLIIIDNASDAFAANENDRQLVRGFLRMLTRIAQDLQACVVLLVHIDKASAKHGGQGQSYSGSTAWHNTARVRYAIVPSSGGIEVRMEKNNLGPILDPMSLRWESGGVLVPAGAAGSDENEGMSGLDNSAVMEAIRSLIEVGVGIPAARTGPSTALSAVRTVPECPTWLNGSQGDKARFWAAITRLERIGWIQRELVRTSDRKERERLTLGPQCPDNYRQRRNWAGGVP